MPDNWEGQGQEIDDLFGKAAKLREPLDNLYSEVDNNRGTRDLSRVFSYLAAAGLGLAGSNEALGGRPKEAAFSIAAGVVAVIIDVAFGHFKNRRADELRIAFLEEYSDPLVKSNREIQDTESFENAYPETPYAARAVGEKFAHLGS